MFIFTMPFFIIWSGKGQQFFAIIKKFQVIVKKKHLKISCTYDSNLKQKLRGRIRVIPEREMAHKYEYLGVWYYILYQPLMLCQQIRNFLKVMGFN